MSDSSLIPPAGLPATLPAARPPGPAAGSVADVLHQRRHRTGGWTPVRVAAFIEKLAETGSVTRAAAYVRLSTAAAYALRNHPDGAPFAAAWDDAVGARHEMLAEIALDRVRDGVERLRWWKGECVGADRVFSDRLLMFMLDRTDPMRRGGGRASDAQAAAARARVDDAGALDRLLAPPAAPSPAAVPLPGLAGAGESVAAGAGDAPAVDDDDDPAEAIHAALADELAAETALSPEHEAMTAAFLARLEARTAAAKAEQAAFDAMMDAGLHPDRAAK